jgi:N-glycosylase/DNA lyase
VGAQAAALLATGGPVGDVPPPFVPDGCLRLTAPPAYELARVARSHGGVGLAPTAWDGSRLHLRLPDPVVVGPDLVVVWSGPPPPVALLRHVLALEDDLSELHDACDRVPGLGWARDVDAGRVLRAPTVWQDLVGVLASTNASYAATQRMVRTLVGDGPFPPAHVVLGRDLSAWGYRADALRALASAVVEGLDPQRWRSPDLPDEVVAAEVRALRGFGPFAAASLLPLLGRPRPLVTDGWLRGQLGGLPDGELQTRYAPAGRWAGTCAWLHAATWLHP